MFFALLLRKAESYVEKILNEFLMNTEGTYEK